MSGIMKKCCGLCPYSRKNTLYVHPSRAEEFAYSAENPYTDFVCHKTGVVIEEDELSEILGDAGDIVRGEKSLTCAGFHAMQNIINGNESISEIEIDYKDHFSEPWDMIEHHMDHFEKSSSLKGHFD